MSINTPGQFPELEPCESLVTNGEALLYRQIHPGMLSGGEPGSHAFRPSANDGGKLSFQDGTALTPQAAWELYTDTLKRSSAGIWGVTVAEAEEVKRRVIDDAACTPTTPHHRSIDFRDIHTSRRQCERVAVELKRAALRRGTLFRADEEQDS